jgi:preprotein translocase SecF subunit
MRMLKFFSKPNIDFLKIGHTMLPVSCVAIVLILGFMVYKGKAICGIDFTGGTRLTYEYTERVPEMTVTEELAKVGFPSAKVSYKTNIAQNSKIIEIILPSNDLSIDGKTKTINPVEQVRDILNKANPKSNFSKGEEVTIGGLIGWEFSKAAIIAFILANIGMIIYLSLRFELAYGVAATLANLHDIIIATGIFLLCGGELSLQVLAALLTILGFSVNDTIIVFDRIREDVGLVKNKSYKEIINLSINQTLSRTVITSFTVFLVTLIMYIMGGNSMRDFVFVMLVGVVAGTYSSIFVASPIISVWHKRLGIGLTADQKENNKVVTR